MAPTAKPQTFAVIRARGTCGVIYCSPLRTEKAQGEWLETWE